MAIFGGTVEQIENTENKANIIYKNEGINDSKLYPSVKAVRNYVGESNRVVSTVIEYNSSASGTTPPVNGWTSSVPSVEAGNYLWSRTVITYTDNTTSTVYGVSRMGKDGSGGGSGGSDIAYETGTWTPLFSGGGWLGSDANLQTKGTYERIGNQVYCSAYFTNYSPLTSTVAANKTSIGSFNGLPFVPKKFSYLDNGEDYTVEITAFTILNGETDDGSVVPNNYSLYCSRLGNCSFYCDGKTTNWTTATVAEGMEKVKKIFAGYDTRISFMYEVE